MITIRVLVALASIYDITIHQMDVKTAFLHGDLQEEIYMDQLEGLLLGGMKERCVNL